MSPSIFSQRSPHDGKKTISGKDFVSVSYGWIDREELPVSPVLKVEKRNDPWYEMSEEEVEDRKEFIRCYINKDFELLLFIPIQLGENDFWFSSHQEFMASAFNTWDFQRDRKPFNKYAYRIRKILDQVKELAILHSCISQPEGRANIQRRYESLVDNEFRDRLLFHAEKYKFTDDDERRFQIKRKIQELNRRILQCKMVWEKYSPREEGTS
jgi:hypothetical protein